MHTPCPASHKITRQFLHYDRYRVARCQVYTCTFIHCTCTSARYVYVQYAKGVIPILACDACAADHVINSSRPSPSVFPPPHLIITHNAHGVEEGEGLGTRLDSCTMAVACGLWYTLLASVYYRTLRLCPPALEQAPLMYIINLHGTTITCTQCMRKYTQCTLHKLHIY